jgi:uncharacterized membrane protein YvbJ
MRPLNSDVVCQMIISTINALAMTATSTGQQATSNNAQQNNLNSIFGQSSDNILENIIIGIGGIIIGAILYHLLTNRRNRIERKIKAGERLITAFDEAI